MIGRRIVSLLNEYRQAELSAQGAKPERLRECQDMFEFMDGNLSGALFGPNTRLAEVMTTADFHYALGTFIQRQMLPGYQAQRFAFEPLVKMVTVPNFMSVDNYMRQAGLDNLEYVAEKGQARPGNYVDATPRSWRVYNWKKQFEFSFEALVNDDLQYFADTATLMGQSARRTLEMFVSRFYTNITTIARLVGLAALYSSTGRLTSSRLDTAAMCFAMRTDARGAPMAVTLKYLVTPASLTGQVYTIQNSQLIPELATNAVNPANRVPFTHIVDPYIAALGPNIQWWAFSDYRVGAPIPFVLARWTGIPAPMLIRKKSDIESFTSFSGGGGAMSPIFGDFVSNNVTVMVWDTWGTYIDPTEGNLVDYRGAYYSSGIVP